MSDGDETAGAGKGGLVLSSSVAVELSLEDRALEAMLEWLSRSETRPGEPVPLRKIASQLGMSRTPVRTAVGRLMEQGLVSHSPHLGFTVATPTLVDLHELFDIRLMAEEHAVRRYFEHGRRQPVAPLLVLADACDRLAAEVPGRRDLYQAVRENDAAFHRALVALSGSARLLALYDRLHLRVHVTRAGWQQSWEPSRFTRSAEEHRAVTDAIVAGDVERAIAHLRSHILRVRDQVTGSPAVEPGVAAPS